MATKPIPTNPVADLPTNWATGQTVSPSGTDVGLSAKHGYNYLAAKVNEALTDIGTLNEAIEDVGDAVEDITLTSLGGVAKSGDTMSGALVAGGSQAAGTAQVRNIVLSDQDISNPSSYPDGTLYFVYES